MVGEPRGMRVATPLHQNIPTDRRALGQMGPYCKPARILHFKPGHAPPHQRVW